MDIFIRGSRGKTPMPSKGPTMPAKKNSGPASLTFTQEELSRRNRGSAVLKPPVGPKVSNRS